VTCPAGNPTSKFSSLPGSTGQSFLRITEEDAPIKSGHGELGAQHHFIRHSSPDSHLARLDRAILFGAAGHDDMGEQDHLAATEQL
jgi:hypothetical protein